MGMNMDLFGVGCKWEEKKSQRVKKWKSKKTEAGGQPEFIAHKPRDGAEGAVPLASRYSVVVRLWTCCSRAWLYWRSICSSVWSFLTRSSRRAISVLSLRMSGFAAGARKPCVGGAAGGL